MKTALRSILIILLEIAAIGALLFGCIQLFPGKDEVNVSEEDFTADEVGNFGGNVDVVLEEDAEDAEGSEDEKEDEEAPEEAPAE